MKGRIAIKVEGLLDKKRMNWFEGMTISYAGNDTLLTGDIMDEAHLHGILNQVRGLNLKLLSINRVEK